MTDDAPTTHTVADLMAAYAAWQACDHPDKPSRPFEHQQADGIWYGCRPWLGWRDALPPDTLMHGWRVLPLPDGKPATRRVPLHRLSAAGTVPAPGTHSDGSDRSEGHTAIRPYYADDKVTLYHGDALGALTRMADECVDIVVTSPPYNMGLTPGGNGRGMYRHPTQKAGRFDQGYSTPGDDALDPAEYGALRVAELWEMWRVSRLGVFWNHRPRVIHGRLLDPLDSLTFDGLEHPPVRQRIILNRGTGIDVSLRQFCTRGEYLYLFAKPDFRLVDHAASGMGDVWDVGIATGIDHPAPFPLSVPTRCIDATGADIVLDPFAGSGTTLVAAKAAGACAIGVELSEAYCEIAAKRLAQGALDFGAAS